MAERVKPIIIKDTDSGNEYTLEFSREAIKFASDRGFSVSDLERYPLTFYDMFFYAFRMHHKNVARNKTDELLDAMGGLPGVSEEFITRMLELWEQGYESAVPKEENPRIVVEM